MTRWTEAQVAEIARRNRKPIVAGEGHFVPREEKPKAKFGNVPTERDGQKFASKLESNRFLDLQLLEKAGEIRDLKAQVSFPLIVNDELIGAYVADAVYFDVRKNRKVVEDSKGVRTPMFKWKARHFRAQFGFPITEVKRGA